MKATRMVIIALLTQIITTISAKDADILCYYNLIFDGARICYLYESQCYKGESNLLIRSWDIVRIYLLDSHGLDTSLISFAQYDENLPLRHSERSTLCEAKNPNRTAFES